MSRSNPSQLLERPAKKYLKWHGSEDADGGFFTYYDKEAQKDVKIEAGELEFLVLDHRLFSVTGFSKPLESYCFSNEVRTVKDKLVIRTFGNKKMNIAAKTLIEGPYADLKGDGGPLDSNKETRELKYTRCVYILWDGEICHLSLTGKTMQFWLENIERSPAKIQKNWVRFEKAHTAVNGKNTYQYAEFVYGDPATEDEDNEAIEADKIVQAYLEIYLKRNGSSQEGSHTPDGSDESQERSHDPAKWREFDMDGVRMGTLTIDQIREYRDSAEEANLENDYTDCLTAAMQEYSNAAKTWEEKKDAKGRFIKDYSLEELRDLQKRYLAEAPMHKSRMYVEIAIEEKVATAVPAGNFASFGDFNDEADDIPF
jgi:hypothetical protein